MSWSLNIGTIAGTAVRVHVTFLLFLGWIFGARWVAGGPEAADGASSAGQSIIGRTRMIAGYVVRPAGRRPVRYLTAARIRRRPYCQIVPISRKPAAARACTWAA